MLPDLILFFNIVYLFTIKIYFSHDVTDVEHCILAQKLFTVTSHLFSMLFCRQAVRIHKPWLEYCNKRYQNFALFYRHPII